MTKALIIGSEGNIGKPLVKYLKGKRYDVRETDVRPEWRKNYSMADINSPIDLLPLFDWKPDVVFILSAMVSRVTCEQASSLAIRTNLGGINNVLQLCKRIDAMTVFFQHLKFMDRIVMLWTNLYRILCLIIDMAYPNCLEKNLLNMRLDNTA